MKIKISTTIETTVEVNETEDFEKIKHEVLCELSDLEDAAYDVELEHTQALRKATDWAYSCLTSSITRRFERE